MTYYIQMKDGVAFAYVESETPVENSVVLQSGIDPNLTLGKKLIDGEWIDAPLIYFIEEISSEGFVEKINSTVYSSDITGEIIPSHVGIGWKKEGDDWINYPEIEEQQILQNEKISLQNEIDSIMKSRPYPSWIWVDGSWEPPVEKPETNPDDYYWNEDTLSWEEYIYPEEPQDEISN